MLNLFFAVDTFETVKMINIHIGPHHQIAFRDNSFTPITVGAHPKEQSFNKKIFSFSKNTLKDHDFRETEIKKPARVQKNSLLPR